MKIRLYHFQLSAFSTPCAKYGFRSTMYLSNHGLDDLRLGILCMSRLCYCTVCPGSSDPFYIASILYKIGHYFLDILYVRKYDQVWPNSCSKQTDKDFLDRQYSNQQYCMTQKVWPNIICLEMARSSGYGASGCRWARLGRSLGAGPGTVLLSLSGRFRRIFLNSGAVSMFHYVCKSVRLEVVT